MPKDKKSENKKSAKTPVEDVEIGSPVLTAATRDPHVGAHVPAHGGNQSANDQRGIYASFPPPPPPPPAYGRLPAPATPEPVMGRTGDPYGQIPPAAPQPGYDKAPPPNPYDTADSARRK